MEATKEVEGLLDKIRPPRLEDAGLEDCALPLESIQEAFLKAATAVGSRAASIFSISDEEQQDASDEGSSCLSDPWPNAGESLVGIREGVVDPPPPGAGAAEKGSGDKVAAGGTDAEEREEEACVDGLQGLKIGDKRKKSKNDEENEEEEEGGGIV